MSIIASELLQYAAKEMSNAGTNGGRLSSNPIADATKNAIFPDVTQAQRTAGMTDYRKVFWKIANDDDDSGSNMKYWLNSVTPGNDRCLIWEGTQNDTQATAVPPARYYGCGTLNADVVATDTTMDVLVEEATDDFLQNGDTLYITDGTNEEYATISGVPVYAGNVATVALAAGLINGYAAATPTIVASVIEVATVEGEFSSFVVTSVAGTYDEVTYPVLLDHIGTVEQDWSLTFTSATAFNCTGDVLGAVGSGNISTTFQPNNGDFTKPYFTLTNTGWGGSYLAGDTVTFTTSPAATPIWIMRVVPALSAAYSGNTLEFGISGETA